MADQDYQRLAAACACCASEFRPRLQSQTLCSRVCRVAVRVEAKRKGPPRSAVHAKPCDHCGTQFMQSQPGAMYCRKACKLAAWIKRNPERHKAHVATQAAKPRPAPTVCAYFASICAGCGHGHSSRKPWKLCPPCSRLRTLQEARESARLAAAALHKAAAKVVACEECDAAFCPLYGSKNVKLCGPCSADRNLASMRASRLKRKAKQRGAATESVNPLKVFDRDRWRCQLCGVKTPKTKRGTYEDDAPELDHIVPISKGGAHSYANTQCACRRCNAVKSDRPLGQTLLFG